jgi:2-C-methyl-D-erythritol 4-phosphate cytidylyltransferase
VSHTAAVIVAAGKGERLGSPKQFLPLGGIPILLWSVRAFESHPRVGELVIVLPAPVATDPPEWLRGERVTCCAGGSTRRESAGCGIRAVSREARIILVHDAARPFASHELIDRVISAAIETRAALPVLPVVNTIKRVEARGVVETLPREGLGGAQTPQGFEAGLIRTLHDRASREGTAASDDAALCELEGHPVAVVEGDPWNLKITTPADLALAEWLVDSGRVRIPGVPGGAPGSS